MCVWGCSCKYDSRVKCCILGQVWYEWVYPAPYCTTVALWKAIKLTTCCCVSQAYLDELVELHKRLMTLREGHILQQVRLIHCDVLSLRSDGIMWWLLSRPFWCSFPTEPASSNSAITSPKSHLTWHTLQMKVSLWMRKHLQASKLQVNALDSDWVCCTAVIWWVKLLPQPLLYSMSPCITVYVYSL